MHIAVMTDFIWARPCCMMPSKPSTDQQEQCLTAFFANGKTC